MQSLTKVILPSTYRYLGNRAANLPFDQLPIAARNLADLRLLPNATTYRFCGIHPSNTVVLEWNGHWLLYVRPSYRGYRTVAHRFFQRVPWKVDFDHTLGKKIAACHNVDYVLLVRLPPKVNRSHGRHEQQTVVQHGSNSGLYFADQRILSKIVGQPSWRAGRTGSLRSYNPMTPASMGLTLKQRGQLAHALGIEDHNRSIPGLIVY